MVPTKLRIVIILATGILVIILFWVLLSGISGTSMRSISCESKLESYKSKCDTVAVQKIISDAELDKKVSYFLINLPHGKLISEFPTKWVIILSPMQTNPDVVGNGIVQDSKGNIVTREFDSWDEKTKTATIEIQFADSYLTSLDDINKKKFVTQRFIYAIDRIKNSGSQSTLDKLTQLVNKYKADGTYILN